MNVAVETYCVAGEGTHSKMAEDIQGYLNTGWNIKAISQSHDSQGFAWITIIFVQG